MADSYIQLPPDSTGKRLDAEEIDVGGLLVHRQRVISLQGRATQQPGRVWKNRRNATAMSASGVIEANSVTSGYRFYVTNIAITGYNTSATAAGRLDIRNGVNSSGTHRMTFLWPVGVTGAVSPQINMALSYPIEPMLFDVGIYLDFVTGTLAVNMVFTGYEEPL